MAETFSVDSEPSLPIVCLNKAQVETCPIVCGCDNQLFVLILCYCAQRLIVQGTAYITKMPQNAILTQAIVYVLKINRVILLKVNSHYV